MITTQKLSSVIDVFEEKVKLYFYPTHLAKILVVSQIQGA